MLQDTGQALLAVGGMAEIRIYLSRAVATERKHGNTASRRKLSTSD